MERWQLIAGYVPPPLYAAAIALALALALAELAYTLRRKRPPLRPSVRVALVGLRLVAILGLIAIALELELAIDTVSARGPRIVVLVDRSASMALADRYPGDAATTARIERARSFWSASQPALDRWRAAGAEVEVMGFGDDVERLAGTQAAALEVRADRPASDLTRALSRLGGDATGEDTLHDPRPLAGVIVISDGLVAEGDSEAAAVTRVAAQLDVPVTTVSAGAPELRDVAITEVRAGEFAFVENVSEIEATLVAHGLSGRKVEVTLLRDGERITDASLTLPADGVALPLRFEVAPDRTGQFVYEIAVTPIDGEATVENNRWPFVVKVLRDKVRVLHVAGRPDWDVRALRTLLRKDPNVELLSYYILRSHEDSTRERSDARLSLIAFPTAELFEAELGSFDLVVLHNFDAAHHDVGRYLDNIARYVAEGGALVVIGGDLGLATGDYANRPLAAIMPVDIERPTGLSTDGLRPQLTEAGHRHPATARLSSAGLDGWSGLPTLDSYNPVTIADDAAEIGAEILMTRADGAPVLVVAEPGPGRVMVLATGATWRMGFAEDLPLFEGARPYDLLWLGAIRWLLRDAANERLTLETDRPAYRVDEPVTLRASTLSPSYAPEQDVTVDWSLSALGDESRKELRRGTWVTDALGRAHETLEPLPSGAYEAVATRPHDGEPRPDAAAEPEPDDERDGPHARRVFLVRDAGRELAHVDADPGTKLLDRLARETGGIHLSARAGESLPDEPPARPRGDAGDLHIDSRRKLPLWSGLPALLLVLGGLCGEWLVRRRNGLV